MPTEFQTVLQIAGVGTVLLFIALAGLIALMYLLTTPWSAVRVVTTLRLSGPPDARRGLDREATAERDRRQRAVAIAVATARARAARPALLMTGTASPWRQAHRTRRLGLPTSRARARS